MGTDLPADSRPDGDVAVMAFIWGPTPVLLMELFPVGVRSTGVGLIHNVGVALFGGLAPFAINWLIAATGDKISPVYYVVISGVVGVLGLLLLRERRADPVIASAPVRSA